MDITRPPFDWTHAQAVLASAEEGSFSGAARRLGLTQPTIGRQVAAFEARLGVMVFERVGRGLTLTEAGRDLLAHMRQMQAAADRVALTAAGQAQSIEGRIRITASDLMSARILPPFLRQLRSQAPRLEIDVVAANDIRDLMRREADIAIRHIRPDQPDLVARLVREATAHFYAAPAYLDARGRPRAKSDLAGHDFIGFGDPARLIAHLAGFDLPLRPEQFRSGSENGVVAWEMARAGLGIAIMGDDIAATCPDMEPVLPDLVSVRYPVWLTTHRELHTSRRIRLVFDLLAGFLSPPA